jgi:hypothetical protein
MILRILCDCFEFLRYRHLKGFGSNYPLENSKRLFFYGYLFLFYLGSYYFLLEWCEKIGLNIKFKGILIFFFIIFVFFCSKILSIFMDNYFKDYHLSVKDNIQEINRKRNLTIIIFLLSLAYFIFSILNIEVINS